MSENKDNTAFKKLLNKLQEDSWQLELLISGFAIFGLFYAIEPVKHAQIEAARGGETIFIQLFSTVRIFLYILIFNLILHVVIRGLWIGALGLRYVSGDIDYKALNYSKKFTTYLKKKVGSFDSYIEKLENYCSLIFAISFLLIFYIISLTIVLFINRLIVLQIFNNDYFPEWLTMGLGLILIVFIDLGAIFTFIDLVTGGLLKKNQKISKIYFPFYKVFSVLTLSFLYRPLIYNFLDDKFGKRIYLLLLPFYIVVLILTSFYYQKSNYFSTKDASTEIIANHNNYKDLYEDNLSVNFMIQSKVITTSYLNVYMPFHPSIEDLIFKFNPEIKPDKDERGMHLSPIITISINEKEDKKKKEKRDRLKLEYVKTFNALYKLRIDSTLYKSDFSIDKIKKNKFGFETYLNIINLPEGKHLLTISRQIKKDSIGDKIVTKFPFWYYKK